MNGGNVITDQATGGGGGNYDPTAVAITGGTITGVTMTTLSGAAIGTDSNGYNELTFNTRHGDPGNNDPTVGRNGFISVPGNNPELICDVPANGNIVFRQGGTPRAVVDGFGLHSFGSYTGSILIGAQTMVVRDGIVESFG